MRPDLLLSRCLLWWSLLLRVALAAPLSADEAVALALASHPELARSGAELSAARGVARESLLFRENPTLEGAKGGDLLELSFAQPLSITGEGRFEHAGARAQVDSVEALVARTQLVLAAETRSAYVDAVVSVRRTRLARDVHALATRQLEVTQAKLVAGEAADLELRLARLGLARAAQALLIAAEDEAFAVTALEQVVGREVQPADLSTDPLVAVPEPTAASGTERSDVVAARRAVDAARAGLHAAHAGRLPPLSVGGFYEDDEGDVSMGPAIGVTVPLWQQNQAAVGEAKGSLVLARAQLYATESRARAEIRTAQEVVALANGTLGQDGATEEDGAAALDAIEQALDSGELDLVQAIVLRDEVVAGQQALIEARAAWARARLRLLLATEDEQLLAGPG